MAGVPGDGHDLVRLARIHERFVVGKAALAVPVIVAAGEYANAVVRAKLADNHGHALVHVVRLHLAERGVHLAFGAGVPHRARPGVVTAVVHYPAAARKVVARTPIVLRVNLCAPVHDVVQECVRVRIVVMHFEHQAALDVVLREFAHLVNFYRAVDARGWPLDYQRTARVVAACRAYRVHECLVVRCEDLGFVSVIVVGCRGFVRAREEQPLVVVLEMRGNLRPVGLLLRVHLGLLVVLEIFFEPAAVPVDVEDGDEASAHAAVHHDLHGIHPALTDDAVLRVAIPGARDADGAEASRLHRIDVGLRRELVAPGCRVARNLHRVADVDAEAHLVEDFSRGRERGCRSRNYEKGCGKCRKPKLA